jgi:ribose transport system substrate-binding protein
VLEVIDTPISTSAREVPGLVRSLIRKHGERWNAALAINDVYFDHAVPVLIALGVPTHRLRMVSAGDGSASAFVRLRSGTYQVGTVAEPLNMQGWQMVDELNRLFAGQAVSRYITPATLVTAEQLAATPDGRLVFDPDNGYRAAYRRAWFATPTTR